MLASSEQVATTPTDGNTWVQCTSASHTVAGPVPRRVLVDWLRCTLPFNCEPLRGALAQLGETVTVPFLGELTPRECGWRSWYDRSAQCLGTGIVAWNSDDERNRHQGLLVDLPGSAVAALGEQLLAFLRWVVEVGGRFSRVDYAIDDVSALIDLDRLEEADEARTLISRSRETVTVQNRVKGERAGWTFYVGSRHSEGFVRFYDKRQEQLAKGREVSGSWHRLEFECKGDLADALVQTVLPGGSGTKVLAELRRRLRFVQPTGEDTNKRRWDTCWWWEKLLQRVEAAEHSILAGERLATTLDDMRNWIEYSVAPVLSAVVTSLATVDGNTDWLWKLLEDASSRWKQKHRLAMADYGVVA